jgi:hypothetical protein
MIHENKDKEEEKKKQEQEGKRRVNLRNPREWKKTLTAEGWKRQHAALYDSSDSPKRG